MFANRISGVTLIELLIACLLSLFILMGMTGMYVTTEKNQQIQTALNTIQENARSAIQFLQMDLHNAGNMGCAHTSVLFTKISGTNNTITIRGASVENATVLESMQDQRVVYVTKDIHVKAGDAAIISSCRAADIFNVQAVNANHERQQIQTAMPLSQRYDKYALVSFFNNDSYFVSDTGRRDFSGLPVYALYVKNGEKPKRELVEGVHAMQISYVTNQNNLLRTRAANDISDWSAVVAIKVNLTMDSMSEYALEKPWFAYLQVGQ